ncbi:hypothetical protein [uncultured Oxalicibacterium sp.]|uniref:hypothetical protein n=1 Tax=uncultured Oxalicibacterium sp. TaxID=1168540 RepID=UPI0025ED3945|nr:hypothetical protein [uncultured Oxalicibacterium sp.]
MKQEKDNLRQKDDMPKARGDEKTIHHETVPGQRQDKSHASKKEKAATSTADDDLN